MEPTSLYWLHQMLATLPLALWVYFGLGLPWALVALPRSDWQDRPMLVCLAFALGPALLTAWMFVPGVIGGATETALLQFDLIFVGTLVIALIGTGLAWLKTQRTTANKRTQPPLKTDEKLLIGLIIAALSLRVLVIAFWPFTAYDPMWVYGYQGRLYTMLGYIPQDIGYYPQFMSLQYAFMQSFVGNFDDHAARVVLPFLQIGAVLAAYVLGARLFNRRVGIVLAALWALYHHVGLWSHVGDLEIPQTFLFTLTAVFFLMAWFEEARLQRRQYALLAGVVFGIAMWTKPTSGAFIWGVVLVVALEFVRARGDWRAWWPRFEVAAITGLACIPLGSLWYVRNIALGLPPLVFPHDSWLVQATRSGDLFGWPLLALMLLLGYLASRGRLARSWALLCGTILVFASLFPSMPLLGDARMNPPNSYITLAEALLSGLGLLLIGYGLLPQLKVQNRSAWSKVGWAYTLALPYFMTWFYSYSYHARLSFAIVPLLALPSAALLAHWMEPQRLTQRQQLATQVTVLLIGVPLAFVSYFSASNDVDWLWSGKLPDDAAKYLAHAPGVFQVALHLDAYERTTGVEPRAVAPGEQRVWFFLPHLEIITDTVPTRYEDLSDATHFVYGDLARWRYEDDNGIAPLDNQVVASLARTTTFTQIVEFGDGRFRYELYELHLDDRFSQAGDYPVGNVLDEEVLFGDFARYIGDDVINNRLSAGSAPIRVAFEVLQQPPEDYWLQLRLLNEDDGQIYHEWQTPFAPGLHAYYNSQLWEPGEIVTTRYVVMLPADSTAPPSDNYRMLVNLVEQQSGEAMPVQIDGVPSPNGYPLLLPFGVSN